ncbi:hypothetical protein ACO0LL_05725 [Undibacterium sp. TC4M20W]|uniref:hypothetical protein n=1 Tax=Undibacterium sp. TC4M20W TaxID=3413052 RepID=UPI003BF26B27
MRQIDMEMNSEKAIVIITTLMMARMQLGVKHFDVPTIEGLIGDFHNVLAVCKEEEENQRVADAYDALKKG